jgi:hypothetical protein
LTIASVFGQEASEQYYLESNAGHARGDWDTWRGFPLVFGTYWWGWLFAGLLVAVALVGWIKF